MDSDAVRLLRALGDLQRATHDRGGNIEAGTRPIADIVTLARRAGIAYTALHPLLHAGIAAGYIAQDVRGALRLTALGWRFHRWDQAHHHR